MIRQNASGRQRLEIYHAPAGVGGETGAPIASDNTFGNGNANSNKNKVAMAGIRGE